MKNVIRIMKAIIAILIIASFQTHANINNISVSEFNFSEYGFVPNMGQYNRAGLTATDKVLFVYEAEGFKLILKNGGFAYELSSEIKSSQGNSEAGYFFDGEEEELQEFNSKILVNQVNVKFLNPSVNIKIEGQQPSSFYYNYYNNVSPVLFVHPVKRVLYSNVYEGIDLIFLIEKNEKGKTEVKYDWIIHPNGNAKDIALVYSGINKMEISENGFLLVETEIGFVQESKPVIKDGNISKEINYQLTGTTLKYMNVPSSKEHGVIIDPTLLWGLYIGGTLKDFIDEVDIDANKNVYLAGRTRSHKIYVYGNKVASNNVENENDILLAKFTSDGELLWLNYFGGDKDDKAYTLCIDPLTQEPIVAGKTGTKTGMAINCYDTTDYKTQTVYGGKFDCIIAKYTTDGVIIRSTYVGGDREDYFVGVDAFLNSQGNVVIYATGTSESAKGIVRPSYTNVEQYVYSGGDSLNGDIIVLKFNADLSERIWGTYYGVFLGQERAHHVRVDHLENIYVVGTMARGSNNESKGNVFQPKKAKNGDMFLAKWRNDGICEWFTYYGADEFDRGRDVVVDLFGNIYITGFTFTSSSTTYPNNLVSSGDVVKPTDPAKKNKDGIIAKFTPDCKRVWGTYFGGSKLEEVRAIQVDPLGGAIYIGGYTQSKDLPVTTDAFDNKLEVGDYFFAKINYNATKILYCTYYGGPGKEGGDFVTFEDWYNGVIKIDFSNGDLYIGAATDSKCGVTPDCICPDSCNYGGFDAFLVKFNEQCGQTPDTWEPNESIDAAKTPALPFANQNTINLRGIISYVLNGSDLDYFKFTIPSTRNHMHMKIEPPNELQYELDLYDANGNFLLSCSEEEIETSVIPGAVYYFSVSGINGAYDNTSCYNAQFSLTTEELKVPARNNEYNNLVKLYPNPATDQVKLALQRISDAACTITITDLTGRVYFESRSFDCSKATSFDISTKELPAGSYSVCIYSQKSFGQLKLMVIK